MEGVDTSMLFAELGLTRGEERILRHATGLRYTAPMGRLERIFYGPLKPSLDVLVTLLVIAILVVASFYVAWRFAELVKSISYLVMGIGIYVVVARRDRLIKKLYRVLEDERARGALVQTPAQPPDLQQ